MRRGAAAARPSGRGAPVPERRGEQESRKKRSSWSGAGLNAVEHIVDGGNGRVERSSSTSRRDPPGLMRYSVVVRTAVSPCCTTRRTRLSVTSVAPPSSMRPTTDLELSAVRKAPRWRLSAHWSMRTVTGGPPGTNRTESVEAPPSREPVQRRTTTTASPSRAIRRPRVAHGSIEVLFAASKRHWPTSAGASGDAAAARGASVRAGPEPPQAARSTAASRSGGAARIRMFQMKNDISHVNNCKIGVRGLLTSPLAPRSRVPPARRAMGDRFGIRRLLPLPLS